MNNFKTDGIIIKRTSSGEADSVLTFLTPYYGKMHAIAKGSRKITSKRAPNLELFCKTSFLIYRGKNSLYVQEAKALATYEHMKKNLDYIQNAYQIAELIAILTRENQEIDGVYDLLSASFDRLNEGMRFNMNEYKYRLLLLLGFLSEEKKEYDLDSYIEEIAQRRLYTARIYE
jgi:DNA repair protein RecO (recombination protein O)